MNSSVLSWLKKLAADRRVAEISWQTVPGHWTREGETARPIAGQVSPWNDEVAVNGRTQMSTTRCRRHWDAHVMLARYDGAVRR